jgi:hypothetical protein
MDCPLYFSVMQQPIMLPYRVCSLGVTENRKHTDIGIMTVYNIVTCVRFPWLNNVSTATTMG